MAGDTVTLALSNQGDKFKVILGDRVVKANGAVITLVEGQSEVRVALVQEGDLTEDASTTLSATYNGEAGTAVSNAWALNLKDNGGKTNIFLGDQRAKVIGTETQQSVTPDKPNYGTYAWGEISRAACRNLLRFAPKSIAACAYSISAKGRFGLHFRPALGHAIAGEALPTSAANGYSMKVSA